jgi:hypothetical protein
MRSRKSKRSARFAGSRVAGAVVVASIALASLVAASFTLANTTAAQDANGGAGTGRETEFVAMTGPAQESVPGGALLVSAYAAVFVLLAAYVGRLALLQAATSRELARLEAALRAADAKGAPSVESAQKGAEGER